MTKQAAPAAPLQAAPSAVGSTPLRIGSEEHKQLFCRTLLDSFDPYKPAIIAWPDMEEDALARLRGLPFWDVAVQTEGTASARIDSLVEVEQDPLLKEALTLQSFEESRHKKVLENMLANYDIPLGEEPEYRAGRDPEWAFLRMGYGECLDSFFAFGLFKLASETGFFPEELTEVFEPVIQEEARHILFFVNWLAYVQARRGPIKGMTFGVRRMASVVSQAADRVQMGRDAGSHNFTNSSQDAVGLEISARQFLGTCLEENDRRMARYDERLLRPKIVPRAVRLAMRFLPRG